MAKEVLELEVKSNIKQVTKDQEKYNKELAETKSCSIAGADTKLIASIASS